MNVNKRQEVIELLTMLYGLTEENRRKHICYWRYEVCCLKRKNSLGGGEVEREQTTASETKEFIKLVKSLNIEQQAGLYLVTEGLKVIDENKKSGS